MKNYFKKFSIMFVMALIVLGIGIIQNGNVANAASTTWNPNDKGSKVTLSNNNLTASYTNYTGSNVRATEGKSQGKWYWEVYVNEQGTKSCFNVGISNLAFNIENGYFYLSDATKWLYRSGLNQSKGKTYGLLLDMNSLTLEIREDNVTKVTSTIVAGTLFPTCGDDNSAGTCTFTANFGLTSFKYDLPSGYLPYDSSSSITLK